jgi:hypothetical protein
MSYRIAATIDSFVHPPSSEPGTITVNCSWISLESSTAGKATVTLLAQREFRLLLADALADQLQVPAWRILVL